MGDIRKDNFDPGDALKMHTRSSVKIAHVGLVVYLDAIGLYLGFQVTPLRDGEILEDCPVGVAGDDSGDTFIIAGRPFMEAFIYFIAESGIRGGAGGVFYASPLQVRPNMVDEELAHSGDGATAHGVGLVPVNHEDRVVQNDGLVDLNPRK